MKNFLKTAASCPLFSGVEVTELEALLNCLGTSTESFYKGEVIMSEGDPARCLGIVISGSVQIVRTDYSGNRSIMTRLGPSDIFAEAFACADVPAMPVSAVAAADAEVMLINARRIMQPCCSACTFHNRLIFNLMKLLATKNLMCHEKLDVTSKRSTREKLMAYLSLQAKSAGSASFVIPYNRQELADYLEVDRSGLSAEISRLRREGVLECVKNRFTLLSE